MSMGGSDWRGFMGRHRGAVAMLVLAGVLVFAGAVFVFLWFVSGAQSSGLVPATLGLWTMGSVVSFSLYAVFWELLLVGVPAGIAAVAGWRWWKRLPEYERGGSSFGAGSRSTGGGGGASLLLFVAFCVKVYIDGRWNVPVATFTLNYVVNSMVTILVWSLIIFGIPAAIVLTWWIRREMKRA